MAILTASWRLLVASCCQLDLKLVHLAAKLLRKFNPNRPPDPRPSKSEFSSFVTPYWTNPRSKSSFRVVLNIFYVLLFLIIFRPRNSRQLKIPLAKPIIPASPTKTHLYRIDIFQFYKSHNIGTQLLLQFCLIFEQNHFFWGSTPHFFI